MAASIEYAVAHLKVKLVVVLGHEGCGAVRAAQLSNEKLAAEPDSLNRWLVSIKHGLSRHRGLASIRDARARDREAVITNVRAQMLTIAQSPLIMQKVHEGQCKVVGAFYEISSGMVDFIDIGGDVADMAPGAAPQHEVPKTPPRTPTRSPRTSKEPLSPVISPIDLAAREVS